MTNAVTLTVDPVSALIDVPRSIRITGLAAHETITIQAFLQGADLSEWRSEATFAADARGHLDLDSAAPQRGSYSGVDGSGLIWSMALAPGATSPLGDESARTRTIQFTATYGDGQEARAELVQIIQGEGVTRQEVRESGLSGSLYRPAGAGPFPAVIVLNGSGGGINEARAALFASHGYIALALGYFRAPGRPDYISGTPLEYFETALEWLVRTVAPAHDFIALVGHSRGAELSLLLGATYGKRVCAVVAYVPSAVLHGTLRAGHPGEDPAATAWTYEGQPLPVVWHDNRTADWSFFNSRVSPVRQAASFVSALADPDAVQRATIPVEKIQGPILLITGTDDGFWPSSAMADGIQQRLRDHAFSFPVAHLRYEGAGHALQFPFVPTTAIVKAHAVAKIDLTGGGTAEANAHANADSWPQVLAFLAAAVDASLTKARAGQAATVSPSPS